MEAKVAGLDGKNRRDSGNNGAVLKLGGLLENSRASRGSIFRLSVVAFE